MGKNLVILTAVTLLSYSVSHLVFSVGRVISQLILHHTEPTARVFSLSSMRMFSR